MIYVPDLSNFVGTGLQISPNLEKINTGYYGRKEL
jgi:hypothetical protein